MNKIMFFEKKSKFSFDDTVTKVSEAAKKNGWHVPDIRDLQKVYQEAGHKDMTKLKTIALCKPHGAYKILNYDKNKRLAAMMPIQLAVYERKNGEVYVSGMNIGFMGKMFGGIIKEVMNEGAIDIKKTLYGIIKK
tara:strand:- start:25 stop:429 length:405 start_codon:yes stop_codon:yes gene_type:complete